MRRTVPALLLLAPLAAAAQPGPTTTLDEIVVTATRRPEPRSSIAGTVQVIDEDAIRRSTAQSMTDLLAEQGAGFFSEWTPGQTSINIRGGTSDGQGRDFRSQVLVLLNGRRAGTANLSKLSPADVERIEIIRGPASVVYGSQAIGGVINLILRDGRTSPGGQVEASGGPSGWSRAGRATACRCRASTATSAFQAASGTAIGWVAAPGCRTPSGAGKASPARSAPISAQRGGSV
ncbi:TonB-dependent receptor plug domain-containing protein [Siccirubricoccus deserti]